MQLAPMDEAEAARVLGEAKARFLDDVVASGELARAAAEERTAALLAGILPEGVATPGHHFRRLRADGADVGSLWFAERLCETPPHVYVYDILVHPGCRGRGHGGAALQALEVEARPLGASQILLSVFAHNAGAIRLYERLGYEPCERGGAGMRMRKAL